MWPAFQQVSLWSFAASTPPAMTMPSSTDGGMMDVQGDMLFPTPSKPVDPGDSPNFATGRAPQDTSAFPWHLLVLSAAASVSVSWLFLFPAAFGSRFRLSAFRFRLGRAPPCVPVFGCPSFFASVFATCAGLTHSSLMEVIFKMGSRQSSVRMAAPKCSFQMSLP